MTMTQRSEQAADETAKPSRPGKAKKVSVIISGAILAIIVALVIVASMFSPGKIAPLRDESGNEIPGSISEKIRVDIGGIEQGMFIQGKNSSAPVLLFLSGGPGNPEYIFAKDRGVELENDFVVCWWEQRGSGMSFTGKDTAENVTIEQLISDTVEVTNYLRNRFKKEKIYIMGHSFGSFLGVKTVSEHPELYTAYIGVGQVTNQYESEKRAYTYIRENGDAKVVSAISEYNLDNISGVTDAWLQFRSNELGKLGHGVYHNGYSQWNDILKPLLTAREYTVSDKVGYLRGALAALKSPANDQQMTENLFETVKTLAVPVYIFHGKYDSQVNYELSQEWYESLDSPRKAFYTFGDSAHSPFLEEPERFLDIIESDVIN